MSHQAATRAIATRMAVVAAGTLNTVAQAAHAAGCAMGMVPQGTFNYFARTHDIPPKPAEAVRLLLRAPIDFRVIAKPLYLLKPQIDAANIDARSRTEGAAP